MALPRRDVSTSVMQAARPCRFSKNTFWRLLLASNKKHWGTQKQVQLGSMCRGLAPHEGPRDTE